MSNEVFDVNNVKQEFLQNIGAEYTQVFSERQLEMSVYMLNDFCNALASNNLVLLRLDQQPEPAYQAPPTPQMGVPPQYQQQQQQYVQPQPPQYPQQDPFQEQQAIQQQIRELNSQLPRAAQLPPMQQQQHSPMSSQYKTPTVAAQDVDLSVDKPKSFADKIKEMRAGTKKPNRINPDDDN